MSSESSEIIVPGRADFIAAKPTPSVIRVAQKCSNTIVGVLGISGVDYDQDELERFRALAGERVLLTPNHPTNTDPALVFHLSAQVNQSFRYLACREAFDACLGLWGHVIKRIGAHSVIRGTADRASFRATRELLASPASKLVIFPEGEVYSQNDTLLPFHDGVFQLAFWALEDARKSEASADLFIQPVALKYKFTTDMRLPILFSLNRLEHFTGSPVPSDAGTYERLRGIGFAMLRSLEKEYRLPSPKEKDEDLESDFTPRLDAIKEAILQRVALAVGIPDPRGETLPERMRTLIHAIEIVTRDEHDLSAKTPYDTELRRLQRERARPLLRDLDRIANWIAVYDGYVREDPTPERLFDLLVRLERECFGKSLLTGPRRARVRLPEPINLGDRLAAYKAARRAEVRAVAKEAEKRIFTELRSS